MRRRSIKSKPILAWRKRAYMVRFTVIGDTYTVNCGERCDCGEAGVTHIKSIDGSVRTECCRPTLACKHGFPLAELRDMRIALEGLERQLARRKSEMASSFVSVADGRVIELATSAPAAIRSPLQQPAPEAPATLATGSSESEAAS